MKINFDNVDFSSLSGPNSFGKKLAIALTSRGHQVSNDPSQTADVQLSFIQQTRRVAPKVALRLDGIYFNTQQDWNALNKQIRESFSAADFVFFQSEFNRRLTEKYFGFSKPSAVIGNGTSFEAIKSIKPFKPTTSELARYDEFWCCSSSWRPHKRLKDNIEYFTRMKQKNAALIVMGRNPTQFSEYSDVFYTGEVSWETCISVYKASKTFVHLAFLDHCPNVVVDARACGCNIVVASSGGTKEIAGPGATVVEDLDWDMRPLDLYSPPPLDYTKSHVNNIVSDVNILSTAERYDTALSAL